MAETWWDHRVNHLHYGDSINHPSRVWLMGTVREGSVLEVGCGSGYDYQNLHGAHGSAIAYRGYDYCENFVKACQAKFPEGDFRVGNIFSLPEQTCSWDTVFARHVIEHTRNWKIAIEELFRIARKRAIVIIWRPLSPHPSFCKDHGKDAYCWDFNETEFWAELKKLTSDIQHCGFEGQNYNHCFILEKNDLIFDLDDFCDKAPNIDLLLKLKEQFPGLKVTLFAIPAQSSVEFLRRFAALDWIELAVHGYDHVSNTECKTWDKARMHQVLDDVETLGCFVKGFRAPGWVLNPDVAAVLRERGYWLACHRDHRSEIGEVKLPIYWSHHPWMLHGHMQELHTGNILTSNGLSQLCANGAPFHGKSRFHFVSEMIE